MDADSGTPFGRYRLLGELGRGGMGQVYRAYDTETHREVAVKVLPRDSAEDDNYQKRFRREARIAAGLNDPHVVPIHGYGEIDGRLYVDMRLIQGRDLDALIAENGGRLSASRAVPLIEQVATALETAHRAGLVHRDIKPSNILVAARDFVYLIDFGIARAATDTAITGTGHTMGTMAYMAPERFSGTTDPRADVYSLACVLFECLTGRRPYPGNSLEEQITGHLKIPPPQPSTVTPGVSPAFDEVIARGMAKDLEGRYQTPMELANAARAALAGATPSGAATRVPRRTIVGASVIGLAVVAALIVAIVIFGNKGGGANNSASKPPTTTEPAAESTTETAEPARTVPPLPVFAATASLGANCQYPASSDPAARPVKPPQSGKVPTDPVTVDASLVTNQGTIPISLANNESPCTVNSFVSLAKQGFFDNTSCHRLTTASSLGVLQCGDPKKDGTGGPGYQFANEYPLSLIHI